MTGISEASIQAEIMSLLHALDDVWAFKTVVSSRTGVPDIIACVSGIFVGFEVKTAKGRQQADQVKQQVQIERAQGKYYVVRSPQEVLSIILILRGIKDEQRTQRTTKERRKEPNTTHSEH